MRDDFSALCGITEEEIRTNLDQELYELADRQRMGYEEVCRELKACYDGYHFYAQFYWYVQSVQSA